VPVLAGNHEFPFYIKDDKIFIMQFGKLKKNLSKDVSIYPIVKIAVLGDSATQFLFKAIKARGQVEKLCFDIYEADYDQIEQQIFDSTSELYAHNPDFIIISQASEKLLYHFYQTPNTLRPEFAEHTIQTIERLWSAVSNHSKARIIHYNFSFLNDAIFGNFSSKAVVSFPYQLRKLNVLLMELSQKHKNAFVADIDALQSLVGRSTSFDSRLFVSSRLAFALDFLPLVAKHTVDIVKTLRGTIKKCLILDLDNTIWGGIIGDDGMSNIQIGDLGLGRAFDDVQTFAKELKNRGILLAVCSKNTEEIAKEPFIKHPDMILRLEDIAVFVANWNNKVDNIKHIQAVLNIGFDSMVFIDDNPFERTMVKEMLPAVTVPELPEDPSEYVPFLRTLNLFETASYSGEDLDRTRQYQTEMSRAESLNSFTSIDDYLQSLDMTSVVRPFDTFTIPRVAQLSQRSNQFNLRTVRYTEEDVAKIRMSDSHITMSFTLEDKFGDHGLIGLIIMKKESPAELFIDTWIMSCRVLKRGMEEFMVNQAVKKAREAGFTTIIGEYLPTSKNGMVKDLYKDMGFSHREQGSRWLLDIAAFNEKKIFIKEHPDDGRLTGCVLSSG
jgi:FkbH-like protein